MQSPSIKNSKTTKHSNFKYKKLKQGLKSFRYGIIIPGSIAIIVGLSLIIFQATIMSFIAEQILNLNSDSSIFKMWQKYPMKVRYSLRFFNWTNHKDFYSKSIKPKFEEIGPYVFLEDFQRIDVVRNDNNNTITFRHLRTYSYDSNLPNNGNLSDRLITINYLPMIMAHIIKDWHDTAKDIFSEYLSSFDPYYYFDTIVDTEFLTGRSNPIIELSNYFDFILPDFPRMDGFGWTKIKNGDPNYEGVYNIANGVNRQFDILKWNYHSVTPYFNKSCGEVKGSVGDIYSFPLNKEFIYIFVAEICRFIKFYFEEEVIIDGIKGYKYSITKLSLDNGTLNPENECFCEVPCLPSGLIGVSACRYNLNVYISLPNYYNADPSYLDPFEGLNPQKQKDEAYVVVEPNSLLCLEFKIAAQLNMFIYPVDGISFFDDFPKLYFPLLRLDTHVQLPDDIKSYLKIYVNIPYVIIVIAAILITLGIYIIYYGIYKFKKIRSLEKSRNVNQELIEMIH